MLKKSSFLLSSILLLGTFSGLAHPAHALGLNVNFSTDVIHASFDGEAYGYGGVLGPDGNLYVSGFAKVGSNRAIWIGKYNPSLVLIATATLSSPAKHALGRSLAFGPDGNLYVSGKVHSSAAATTVGDQAWIGKYNTSLVLLSSVTISSTMAQGIAIDGSGDVYVAGETSRPNAGNSTGPRDGFLAKFNSSLQFISSATFAPSGGNDKFFGLELRDNILYAVGKASDAAGGSDLARTVVATFDTSLKYVASSTFTMDATRSYGFKSAFCPNGDLYVVGRADSADSIYIARLDPSSLVLKSSAAVSGDTYRNAGTDDDQGAGIACDSSGRVFVSGYHTSSNFPMIAVFDSSLRRLNGAIYSRADASSGFSRGLLLDGAGSLYSIGAFYISGPSLTRVSVAKFSLSPAAALLGTSALGFVDDTVLDNTDIGDAWRSAKIGPDGNLYAVGQSSGPAFPYKAIFLGKYDTSLNLLASVRISSGNSLGRNLAFGPDGSVYAVGKAAGGLPGNSQDYLWLGRFNSSLVLQSSYTLRTSTNDFSGFGVAVGSDGAVYANGHYDDVRRSHWIGKFTPSLTLLSSATYSTGANTVRPFDLIMNGDALYSIGSAGGGGNVTPLNSARFWVGKYDTSLVLKSTAEVDLTSNAVDLAFTGAFCPNGDLYLIGESTPRSSGSRVQIARLDGATLGLKGSVNIAGYAPLFTGDLSLQEQKGLALTCDANGNLYAVAATTSSGNLDTSSIIIQLDQTPAIISSITYRRSDSDCDFSTGLAEDGSGNLFAVGSSHDQVNGVFRAWVGKFKVPSVAATGSTGSGGTSLTYNAPQGPVTVTIPSGAFTGSVSIVIQSTSGFAASNSAAGTLTSAPIPFGIAITLGSNVQPSKRVTITVDYRDSDVTGLDETQLVLARYDPAKSVWIPLPSTVDTVNNRITALTDHFSVFQVMALTPAATTSGGKIFPNPYRPALGHTGVTFSNLPANTVLKIYTVAGERVRVLETNGAGLANWDGRNEGGWQVGSGVYFVHASAPSGGGSKTFKLAVQR